ncbi:AzlC family ABC transporter permease [Sulfitobacter sp. D35]|uniref:AzlC family ABC transporter permease n=1 Tax=Sulfitobacter sp. D35 TaxID=3083252 RepID=UPI00296FA286|nr:AzlC family ABC transporter permease [Sulfitobacter sp. D35]MDW4499782.1 AzlC family ABC transporter permease [Sulfitobacter sp. D35]
MSSTTAKPAFWKGFRSGLPFVVMVAPFATLFGVFAVEAGLTVVQTMTFSAVVFAGAAQFTALQLMQENAPTAVVLISALAVNLRVAMYSASLTPYLGAAPGWQRVLIAYFTVDQSYACSVAEYERHPEMSLSQRVAFFAGVLTPIVPLWYVFTLGGALAGAQIPESWTIDFALPICFLAMVAPLLRTPAHIVAALTAVAVSIMARDVPYSLGLVVAGIAGMMVGAQTEAWAERRRARA